jgi:acetyltransferase-like isoleucine patch superfamily enzyme
MKNEQLRKHLKLTWRHKRRIRYYKKRLKSCGDDVFFDKNIEILRYPGQVSINSGVVIKEGSRICACNEAAEIFIGKNTTVGYHTFIFSSNRISIGNDCLIAPFVYVVDSDHEIKKGQLINEQPNVTAPVSIGSDVWIGTGAKILKGVTIADGAVIAAGAVVSTNVGPNEIFGGVPAKKISERK